MYFDMSYILWPAGQTGSMEFEISERGCEMQFNFMEFGLKQFLTAILNSVICIILCQMSI
jgi:hypothetical protein